MNNVVSEAAQKLQPFGNAKALTQIFEGVANVAAAMQDDGERPAMALPVLIASDDPHEITTFTALYAEALHALGINRKNRLVEVDWKNLALRGEDGRVNYADVGQAFDDAFRKAKGGVLLIRNAFEKNTSTEEKMANLIAMGELSEKMDGSDDGFDITFSPSAPVVVFSGAEKSVQSEYNQSPEPFEMRFLHKVGLRP